MELEYFRSTNKMFLANYPPEWSTEQKTYDPSSSADTNRPL